ncbi:MAG: Uma2 family endonuclease [Planctomycetes bacterium]|nr:Uma2 family endonuclease [Planctomycetota bacterium]
MTTKTPVQGAAFDLIYDDGEPMDSPWHRSNMNLLIESTHEKFMGRTDFYTGGNMFVYYSLRQARAIQEEEEAERGWVERGGLESGEPRPKKTTFRGPDYFCVVGVDGLRERDAWVVWEEDGRYPDLIVELLSESTKREDLGPKKDLYERTFRTLEYLCYDPKKDELLGWRLVEGEYRPIEPDDQGRLWSQALGVLLGRWKGRFQGQERVWIRLYDEDGNLVKNGNERAEVARQRADEEKQRADKEKQRADEEKQRADAAVAEVERLREQMRRAEQGASES